MFDPDIWNSEAHKAMEMQMIEQRDRALRDKRALGCTCGSCDVINVRSFSGAVVTTMIDGPCSTHTPAWRSPSGQAYDHAPPKGGAGNSGAYKKPKKPTTPPPPQHYAQGGVLHKVDEIDTIYERPGLEVEFWRSLVFGWHGQLVRGTVTLTQWWRPFRSWAEYRGSFVMLRWIEHDERTTMDLAGY